MNNTKVLEEFFIWEENNSTEPKMKLENKIESEQKDSIINTKTVNEYENWKTITDPKLRKKMRKKAYYEKNKEEILKRKKVTGKVYRENNKDKVKKSKKLYSINNKEKEKIRIDKWRQKNKEQIRTKRKKWEDLNQDKIKSYKQNYRKYNKDKMNQYHKNYRKENKVKLLEKNRKREEEKRKNDIQYKLKSLLRHRLYLALKGNFKSGSAVRNLGCTIPELKTYLESKFHPDMNWHNHGAWHIDHIKPLSSFDLTDRNQLLEACHYTNLQPLWAIDNLSKGAKTV